MDDFRVLEITKGGNKNKSKAMNQDKGQSRQIDETVRKMLTKGESPIPFEQLEDVMRTIFAARKSLQSGAAVVPNATVNEIQDPMEGSPQV